MAGSDVPCVVLATGHFRFCEAEHPGMPAAIARMSLEAAGEWEGSREAVEARRASKPRVALGVKAVPGSG